MITVKIKTPERLKKTKYISVEAHTLVLDRRGGDIIPGETQFKVIVGGMKHLGDQPSSIKGAGKFVGPLFEATFDLPDNVDHKEQAIVQCRTKHNQLNNKNFFLNTRKLNNILEPHPQNKNEWMMDIAVVPKGWLKPGENIIHIGYADDRYDDFIVDNIVLWFKIKK